MPSWDLFAVETDDVPDEVLPPGVPTLAVEAGVELRAGTATPTTSSRIDHFGASAPGAVALAKLGFTPENVAARARELLDELREDG